MASNVVRMSAPQSAQQQGWVWNGSSWCWVPDFDDCPPQPCPPFPCPPSGFPTPCPPWFPPPAGQAPWYPGANGGVSFSATPPVNPIRGNFWWDGAMLHLFDGAAWVNIGPGAETGLASGIIGILRFTTIGAFTYTPTVGMIIAVVDMVGGGGGGGNAVGTATYGTSGGGGGGGAWARKVLTAAQVGAALAGTVGAGGAIAANGGDTSLGSFVVARGGAAGITGTTTVFGNGGAGGQASASTGDITISGMPGGAGAWNHSVGAIGFLAGAGGGSQLGEPAGASVIDNTQVVIGTAGNLYGGGGSGGRSDTIAGLSASGGPGASGCVFITEFH